MRTALSLLHDQNLWNSDTTLFYLHQKQVVRAIFVYYTTRPRPNVCLRRPEILLCHVSLSIESRGNLRACDRQKKYMAVAVQSTPSLSLQLASLNGEGVLKYWNTGVQDN